MKSTSFYFLATTTDGLQVRMFAQSAEAMDASRMQEALRMCKACDVTFKSFI